MQYNNSLWISSLSETIPSSWEKFISFLKNPSLNSFVLKPSTQYEIRKLISQLHNEKALGLTSIPVTIFKHNADILSRPLSFISNQSFAEGILSDILKIAPVRAIHKKGDTHIVSNCHPISLL